MAAREQGTSWSRVGFHMRKAKKEIRVRYGMAEQLRKFCAQVTCIRTSGVYLKILRTASTCACKEWPCKPFTNFSDYGTHASPTRQSYLPLTRAERKSTATDCEKNCKAESPGTLRRLQVSPPVFYRYPQGALILTKLVFATIDSNKPKVPSM
jgi:hypothetical protein